MLLLECLDILQNIPFELGLEQHRVCKWSDFNYSFNVSIALLIMKFHFKLNHIRSMKVQLFKFIFD